MNHPKRIDDLAYVHFVTFSCHHRRRILDHDQSRRIVLNVLAEELQKFSAKCQGFVLMPDHVHALLWFPTPHQLSLFVKQWKGRSSTQIKQQISDAVPHYATNFSTATPVWQRRYYSFEIEHGKKLEEELTYIHLNPVRAGLVKTATDWQWSSSRWFEQGQSVGVPITWVD